MKPLWTYIVKPVGRKKARQVCNGSPRFTQGRIFQITDSGCIDQVGFRIFIAIAALKNYVIIGWDATNAFANSPPLKQQTYMEIDEQYYTWYESKYNKKLQPNMVLPIQKALQGDPESGNSWQNLINCELKESHILSTTHEICLYRGMHHGEEVLICQQIDDFAAAVDKVSMVIQLDVSFFFRIDAHFLRHQNLIIRSKEARDLILIDQVVDIFKHKTCLQLVIRQQEGALL